MDVLTLSDFELLEELSANERWTELRGRHPDSTCDVRVTVFSRELSDIPQFRAAFRKDRTQLENLHHDTILQYLGSGEADGCLFCFTKYPGGLTLQERLDQGQQFTWDEVADLGWQIASALQFAHNVGISHAGLTPSAVFVSDALRVQVADFGVCRWIAAADDDIARHTTADWLNSQAADLVAFGDVLRRLAAARPLDNNCGDQAATIRAEIEGLIHDLQSPRAPRFPAKAREVQGRLGNLLLSVAGDSIEIVDHRAGQSYGRRSIVDELFDDAETIELPRPGSLSSNSSSQSDRDGRKFAVVMAAILVLAASVITLVVILRR